MRRGRFVTFEGGEGAGKSSLMASLSSKYPDVITTREPGGAALSEEVRKLLFERDQSVTIGPKAEMLLFLAARMQNVEELIIPALEEGKTVLCDRFNDSTIAYQGVARGLGLDFVQDLCIRLCPIQPDKTFYLDVDPEIGLSRSTGGGDHIEDEELTFHKQVRRAFINLAEREPDRMVVIDASRPQQEVFAQVWGILEHL